MTSEVLAVGDELVRGIVADTNAAWIAGRLAAAGVVVARISLLPDDVEVVAGELRAALSRRARLVVTTGGLGPTADDRTLEAVALAAGRPLAPHPWALQFVAGRYRFLAEAEVIATGELTPERRKMAVLPEGAEPLPNETGTAPGVLLRVAEAAIVCLPGVPYEMRTMWDGAVAPLLDQLVQRSGHAEATAVAACNDESVLAPLIADVAARHPAVYVKSRAAEFAPGGGLRVSLAARGSDDRGAATALKAAIEDLRRTLRAAGLDLREG